MNNNNSTEIQIRVRYCEVDAMGVLHHSRYWTYYEMGRTELLRAQGIAYADLEKEGIFFVMAKCSARYIQPARYDDEVLLHTEITRLSAARIDHAYKLYRKTDGVLLSTAETTLACVNNEGSIIAIPEFISSRVVTGDDQSTG